MPQNHTQIREKPSEKHANLSNVKKFPKYERFVENVRYFAIEECRLFTDAIANQEHKLMMLLIYETGCCVGEFVQILLKHLDFLNSAVFFSAANTKTKHQRTGHIPRVLINEIVMYLWIQDIMAKLTYKVFDSEDFLFHPNNRKGPMYTCNLYVKSLKSYLSKSSSIQMKSSKRKKRQNKRIVELVCPKCLSVFRFYRNEIKPVCEYCNTTLVIPKKNPKNKQRFK